MPPAQPVGNGALPQGAAALVQDDIGTLEVPAGDAGWAGWVAASRTRNWILEDPLLDWLAAYGREHSLVADDEREVYDARADFRAFVLEQGQRFEAGVMRCLAQRVPVTTVASSVKDSRSLELAQATVEAMERGDPVIAQGVLRDPSRWTYGIADLLVRSDVLSDLFPGSIPEDEVDIEAPGIGQDHCHYRVVDIKFHSFTLLKDGSVGGGNHATPYQAQVWLYGMALGRIGLHTVGSLLARTQLGAGQGTRDGLPRTARAGRYGPRLRRP